MNLQHYLIRNAYNHIIDVIYGSSLDKAKWIKENYKDYYPFGLSFEKCDSKTAQPIIKELRDRKEKAKILTELLNLN